MNTFVAPLEQLGRDDLARVGGKGANLGELVRAGFPVPDGFVVTTAAYDGFVAHNRLGETIARALREEPGGGATIRAAFEGTPIPPEIERDILAAYHKLGEVPVAVRSSATAEDLPEAAFAGQQDTFLNISDEQALLDAVRRCWASLWTDRAIAYRNRQKIDQQTVKLAVVVQQMVPAEVAGVMFTANPVTGARDEIVIDSSPGLGEAVVSGQVTPDRFVLRKRWWGWSVTEQRPGRREVIIRARSGGGTERLEGSGAMDVPELPRRALGRLASLGAAIERHFGRPQDIEWVWTGRELSIVQARPITALPEPVPRASRPQRMLAAQLAEMLPVRPYPLDQTSWMSMVLGAVSSMVGVVGFAGPFFDRMFVEEDGVVVRLRAKLPFRPTPGVLLAPVRLLRLALRYDPVRWRDDPLFAEAEASTRTLEARDVGELSWEGLLATVREAPAVPLSLLVEIRRYMLGAALAAGRLRVALGLLGRGDRFGPLLSGVESKTVEANRALEDLAMRVRSDPTLAAAFASREANELMSALEEKPSGQAFLDELRTFLDRYGHRETASILLVSQPTWKDAPEVVLGILKGFVLTEARPQAGRPAWEVARDELLAHPLLRLSPLRSVFLNHLARARCLLHIREDTHFYGTMPMPIIRRALLELGRRLVSVGVLDAPEDVFHLKLAELERVGGAWPPPQQLASELRTLVLRREEKRAALADTPVVDPRLFSRGAHEGDALLSGTPGSPGVAEGPARIIRDSSEFGKLRSGEVLVAPYTNPAWTPLFQRAAAVVVDSGGPGSHAAIVAREYGIPAVMATVDGTRRLVDGQRVRVDGAAGLVSSAGAQASDGGVASVRAGTAAPAVDRQE